MRVRELVSTAVAAMLLLSAGGARADEIEASKNPWRGSALAYEHTVSAISLSKSTDPTWDPVYVHTLSLMPAWHFADTVVARANFALEQELTNSDETIKKYEWVWSDINLDLAPEQGWTESESGIRLNGGLRFQIPVSKMSTAQGLNLGVAPGINLSRKFSVMNGLTVRYSARWQFNWQRSQNPEYDGPALVSCGGGIETAECGASKYSPVRNARNVLMHGPAVTFSPIERLTFSGEFNFRRASVYALPDASLDIMGEPTKFSPGSDVTVRYMQVFRFEAAYSLLDYVDLSLGVLSMYADLAPDSTPQTPFFNRYTNIFLGLSLDADGLIHKI